MTADMLEAPPAETNRNGYKICPEGQTKAITYARVTNVAKTLDDTAGLEKWRARLAARGLAARADLVTKIAAAKPDDGKTVDAAIEAAIEAGGGSAKSTIGTALHDATEQIDRGLPAPILPAPYDRDLNAYTLALRHARIRVMTDWIERLVVLDEWQVAGTLDRILELPDGTRAIGDVKTGKLYPQSFAVQLAAYAHANAAYDRMMRTPLPDVRTDIGIVIHLPAGEGRCDLYTVDIAAGWQMFCTSMDVRGWRNRKNLTLPYSPDTTSTIAQPDERQVLRARVEQLRELGHLDYLAALWPAGIPGFKGDHPHTVDELAAISAVVTRVEADKGVPF